MLKNNEGTAMKTTHLLLTLMDIELNLLICRAKLDLCIKSGVWDMAYACGMRFEDAMSLYERLEHSDTACDLVSSIEQIYKSLPQSLLSGFEGGRCDASISLMNADDDGVRIVSESDWVLQDDLQTEMKKLIGHNGVGYCFGYVCGWPDSTPKWNDNSYLTVADAIEGRHLHEDEDRHLHEDEVYDLSVATEILF